MRKIFLAVAAMAMLATACTKDDSALVGNESLVSFSVSSPELQTRVEDGKGLSTNHLQYAFYDETGAILPDLKGEVADFVGSAKINIPLVEGRIYSAIFWADNTDAPYDVRLEDKTMQITSTTFEGNSDKYDAFYKYEVNIDPKKKVHKIELTRPFAQINIATADTEAARKAGVVVASTKVVVENAYKTLDLVNGEVSEPTSFEFAWATKATGTAKTSYDMLAMNYVLVNERELVNVTMEASEETVSESATYADAIERNYTTVPVQRNYQTFILGNLLTTSNEFNVEVEEDFNDTTLPETEVEKLIMKMQTEGGEFTLPGNIELKSTLELRHDVVLDLGGHTINVALAEGSTTNHIYAFENHANFTLKNGTVNARGIFNYGNMTVEEGVTINAIDGNGGYGVRNYEGATFTMNGGTIATTLEDDNKVDKGGYDATTLRVDEGATAVINGGTINNICDYTFAVDNHGKLTINDGTFTSVHTTVWNDGDDMTINGGSFICNGIEGITAHCVVADAGTTTINGGTFNGKDNYNGFNVDASAGAVVYIHGGNFLAVHSGSLYGEGTITVDGGTFFDEVADARLATGYKVMENGGKYVVVANEVDNVVADKAELQNALKAATNNGETNVVIDAAGANIGDLNYGLTKALVPAGSTVTIRNANVQGKSYGNGVNGTVIFEDCTFNNSGAYSIHFDNGTGNVIFKNCDLYGWNSFGAGLASVEFEGCTLTGNGSYALIRSYVDLTLTDCVINTSNANHDDGYSEGVEAIEPATLTENNVTYIVSNAKALENALATGEKTIVLADDVRGEAATTAPYGNKYAFKLDGGVIDGCGHELYMECYGDDYGIMTSGGTVKNVTITEGCRAIMIMYPQQDVIIDNAHIGGDGVLYPINTGEAGADNVNLVVTNSTLAGWTSYGLINSASFTNVKFEQGTYYNNIYGRVLKPYVNTTLTDCSFVAHMNLDLSALANGAKIVIKNCTVDGQAVTAGVFTIPTTDDQYDTELFTVDLPSWATSINDCVVFE